MRISVTILLITICLGARSQTCDTIENQFLNCKDSLGLKQGLWRLTTKNVRVRGYIFDKETGCRYYEDVEYYPLAEGYYENDIRIGTWRFYSGDHTSSVHRRISYHQNGSINDENYIDRYNIVVSADTSRVTGYYHDENDTIEILCQNGMCYFSLPDGSQIVKAQFTDLDMLDYELTKLRLGEYDRLIKQLRKAR